MTNEQILKIAHRMAWRYKPRKDRNHSDTYTFNDMTMIEFARRIMSESAINYDDNKPLTKEEIAFQRWCD